MSYRADRDCTEKLILLVVERLGRGNDDGLARVDPHWIHVLHVAHGNAVVPSIAHDLVLDLLPAAQAFLDQYLGNTAGKRSLHRGIELLNAFDDPTSFAAQRVATPQHHGKLESECCLDRLARRTARLAACGLDANLRQPVHEQGAILRIPDRFNRRAEDTHSVAIKDARLVECKPAVERRLPPEG